MTWDCAKQLNQDADVTHDGQATYETGPQQK
jgi:hypothetical protein